MNVTKYTAKTNFTLFDQLFLIDDVLYVSDSIYAMDEKFDYARKYFSENRTFLGRTSDKYFYDSVKGKLKEVES